VKNAPADGPGQGKGIAEKQASPNALAPLDQDLIDPRLAFLACASARLVLVEEGVMSIDEAFDRDFVELFREIGRLTCSCDRAIMERMDAVHLKIRREWLRDWRWSPS